MAVPLTGLEELKLYSAPENLSRTRLKQSIKISSVATTLLQSAATKDSQSAEDIILCAADSRSSADILPSPATKNLRIASWNVNNLTTESEARVEIIKHVAEAIKLYKFDIVALQEIPSADAMSKLCKALNKDNPLQSWKCKSQQDNAKKLGFVWNSGIIKIEVHDLPFDYFARKPFLLKFKFEGITINLVNLHLTSRGNGQAKRKIEISKKINNDKEQDKLIDLVRHVNQPGTYVFLIGDFNCFPWSKELQDNKYVNLFPLRMYTNTKQDECYDNIIVPDQIKCDRGVFTADNLKLLSDHFPIWAKFSF